MVRELRLGENIPDFYLDKTKAAYWDGKNETDEKITSGIYFYNTTAGSQTVTRKMVVMK